MLQHDKLQFDYKMYQIALGMLDNNEEELPKDLIIIKEKDNKHTGFSAKAFLYQDKVIISFKATNILSGADDLADIQMMNKILPQQYPDAQFFYQDVLEYCEENNIDKNNIVFTGYSLGGSLTQIMSALTGHEGVTFAPYGVGLILKNEVFNLDNIPENNNVRNYGHIDDPIFMINIDYQIGKTYIINIGQTILNDGLKLRHFLYNFKNLQDAVEYNPLIHKNKNIVNLIPNTLSKAKSYAKQSVTWVRDTVIRPTFKLLYNDYDVTEEFLPYDYKNILRFIWNVSGEIEKVA